MKNIEKISNYDLGELSNYYGDILQRTRDYYHVTDEHTSEKKRIVKILNAIDKEIERRQDKDILI